MLAPVWFNDGSPGVHVMHSHDSLTYDVAHDASCFYRMHTQSVSMPTKAHTINLAEDYCSGQELPGAADIGISSTECGRCLISSSRDHMARTTCCFPVQRGGWEVKCQTSVLLYLGSETCYAVPAVCSHCELCRTQQQGQTGECLQNGHVGIYMVHTVNLIVQLV